jgi:hypothetical protein
MTVKISLSLGTLQCLNVICLFSTLSGRWFMASVDGVEIGLHLDGYVYPAYGDKGTWYGWSY